MERGRRRGRKADEAQPAFYYRNGLAVLRHVREPPAWMAYDPRVDGWVAPGHRLPDLRHWAEGRGVLEEGAGPDSIEGAVFDVHEPRDYQVEAVGRWDSGGRRGSVVLPTGAGKTFVAILAIERVRSGTCVIVPTRALLGQWFSQLADAFGAERVGVFYGDEKDPRPVTVTTYHSAFALLERYGDRYDLLVLDEAHHLSDTASGEAKSWHDALRIAPAAFRLGLTATYPDGSDRELTRLAGPVVYRKRVGEMVDAELAGFAVERRFVSLTDDERQQYDRASGLYESFLSERSYRDRYPEPGDAWRVFMAETRTSPRARSAFRAFLERERIVALCQAKLDETGRLMRLFPAERVIVFGGSTEAARAISRRFAIPLVTASTPARERRSVLDAIDSGRLRAVASVRVLDEGWDVPSAKLGIVLGDSTRGGRRQHQQRLGRLLRRQGDRIASLFEIVAADTHEFFVSQKRRKGMRRIDDRQLGLGI